MENTLTVTPAFFGEGFHGGGPFDFKIRPKYGGYEQVGEISGELHGEPLSGTLVVQNSQNRNFRVDVALVIIPLSWYFIIEENINSPILDSKPPEILVLSPQNITYTSENVALTFIINEDTEIWYKLNGHDSRTHVQGNTTIAEFLEDGSHNLTFYAEAQLYNIAPVSEPIYFTVSHKTVADEFFLTILALTILAIFASIFIILVVYLIKKRKAGNPITNK